MKKSLKYMIICLLTVGLYSCDKDDDDIVVEESGANAVLIDDEITVLDQNEDLSVSLFSRNEQFQSVEIQDDAGTVLTEATIADGTATFNASALGDVAAGDAVDIWIVSTLASGEVIRQPATVAVTSAVSTSAGSTIVYQAPTENLLEYSVTTFNAPVDEFFLQWKANDAETWNTSDITLDPEGGEIDLSTLDLDAYGVEPGDVLSFRVVAESGALVDDSVVDLNVVTQNFGTATAGTISDNPKTSQFSFETGGNFAADSEEGEIVFTEPRGIAAANDSGISFVQVTEEGFYDNADLFDAEEKFESSLVSSSSISDAENGDVYVYKITRTVDGDEVVYYGILKVGSVTVVDGEATSINLEFKEGTILR